MGNKLLDNATTVDEIVNLMSNGERYTGRLTTNAEEYLNKQADLVHAEYEGDGWADVIDDQFRTHVIGHIYAGCDPKKVPNEHLQHAVRFPTSVDFHHNASLNRVKNVNTGIRAFCIRCQGGDTVSVRNCPSAICPLFPFRMGKNPFYGKFSEDATSASDLAKELSDAD